MFQYGRHLQESIHSSNAHRFCVRTREGARVPLLVLRPFEIGDAGLGGVYIDCVFCLLPVKSNFEIGVVAGKGSYLCTIQGQNMVDDSVETLLGKVRVINAQIAVKPACLVSFVAGGVS
jgi:hypothetical protein